jgi:AraC-like DNA-binding protein
MVHHDGVSPTMRFREAPPSQELSRLVACYWEFVAGPGTPAGHIHTIPPDGCTSVSCLVGRGPVTLLGPRLESFRLPIYPGTTYVGVRFRPGATRAAIGVSGAYLRDKVGFLEAFAPGLAPWMLVALPAGSTLETAAPALDEAVRQWSRGRRAADEVVLAGAAALAMSGGSARIGELASRSGVGERQFQRRFREEVGLTPKQFARVVRFRAAAVDVAMGGSRSWGEVAADRGYADQAHLVREFAQIFGMTPTEFQTVFAPAIEHDVR